MFPGKLSVTLRFALSAFELFTLYRSFARQRHTCRGTGPLSHTLMLGGILGTSGKQACASLNRHQLDMGTSHPESTPIFQRLNRAQRP